MSIVIQIANHQTAFSPKERVTGQVSWQLDAPPERVELRLLWRTDGRAITDQCVVETVPFGTPQAMETRSFTVTLPDAPYSFSGALITLTWRLDVAFTPGGETASVNIVMAPEGKAISLPQGRPVK